MLEHRILAYRVKHCELQFIVLSTSPTNHTLSRMANPPYFAWEHKYHGVHNPWCYLWRLHRTYCWVLQHRNVSRRNRAILLRQKNYPWIHGLLPQSLFAFHSSSVYRSFCTGVLYILIYIYPDQRSISKFVRAIIWVTDCSLIFAVSHINLTMYNDLLISSSC